MLTRLKLSHIMKKYFMSVAAMAGMMTLAACSSDDVVVNNDNDVQTIQIAVASTGDRATRSRDLNSEEPGQDIQTVKVVIRNKKTNEVVYVGTIDNWNSDATSKVYTDNGHGRVATLKLEGADRLDKGEYTITAVGYTDADFKDNTVAAVVKGNTKAGNFTATVNDGKDVQEAFAGESSISLQADRAAINTSITLHRQVAGYYGYFTSIPVKVGDKEVTNVRLVARSKNTKLEFGQFNSSFTEKDHDVMYVVNGSESATADAKFDGSASEDAYELYDITVKDWFKDGDTNHDGILDEKDTGWENALAGEGYQTYQKGTIFAGGFAVPFAATADKTLELQLLDADGNILKAINVSMATAQPEGDVLGGTTKTTETPSAFSFFRNHMYTIGKKLHNNGTTPDPGVDPDVPEPLDKTQNIVIRVNDNWEVINHLVLGDD